MRRNRLDFIKTTKSIKNPTKKIYKPIKYPDIPLSIDDLYVITTSSDRLDSLAYQFYRDVRLWWIISIANRDIISKDSFGVKSGIEIRIPQNIEEILIDFEEINKSY